MLSISSRLKISALYNANKICYSNLERQAELWEKPSSRKRIDLGGALLPYSEILRHLSTSTKIRHAEERVRSHQYIQHAGNISRVGNIIQQKVSLDGVDVCLTTERASRSGRQRHVASRRGHEVSKYRYFEMQLRRNSVI